MNITEQTRNALRVQRGHWPDIAVASGLSYWWLIKFGQGQIKEPGATKLEKLRAELKNRGALDTGTEEAA